MYTIRKFILTNIVFLLILPHISLAGVKINPGKIYDLAVKEYENLNYNKAIELFDEAINTGGLSVNKIDDAQKKIIFAKRFIRLDSQKEKIKITYILSSSLKNIAPSLNIKGWPEKTESISKIVEKLNEKYQGNIDFQLINPSSDKEIDAIVKKYNVRVLEWPDIPEQDIKTGRGSIGLSIAYGDKKTDMKLLNVSQIPIIGTQYEFDINDIERDISANLEYIIDTDITLGYIVDHGTLAISDAIGVKNSLEEHENFLKLISKNYYLKKIKIANDVIPDNLKCLIIAQPTEAFSDYELYQIDQALMCGTSLAIFTDAFKEVPQPPQQQVQFNRLSSGSYKPMNTGLEKLLEHYGVRVKPAYVMDKNSFKQTMPAQAGGGERTIYFAPMIKNENINKDLGFMHNIKGLITLNVSPISVDNEILKKNDITAHELMSSSDQAWEMSGRINLNPLFIQPPQENDKFKTFSLSYLLEGEFPSFFKEKDILQILKNRRRKDFIPQGKPSKLLIIGSSAILKDNILDVDGISPNSIFISNLIDYMSNL